NRDSYYNTAGQHYHQNLNVLKTGMNRQSKERKRQIEPLLYRQRPGNTVERIREFYQILRKHYVTPVKLNLRFEKQKPDVIYNKKEIITRKSPPPSPDPKLPYYTKRHPTSHEQPNYTQPDQKT